MRHRRTFTDLLATLLAVLLLFPGCRPSGVEQESETSRNSKEVLSEYTIIYSAHSDKTAEKELAVGLRDSLQLRFGATLPMATDSDTDGTGKVILVGDTACTQSVTVYAELTLEDWAVRRMGEAMVLAGGNTDGLKAAIAYFLEYGVTEDGAITSVSHTEHHHYEFAETAISLVSLNLRTAGSAKHNNQGLREPRIVGFLKETMPDSVGTQECTKFWRERLDDALGNIGYRRAQLTHSNPEAMKNYIWYNPKTVKVVDSGFFWLSETPQYASRGFGSEYYISAAWAIFENLSTGVQYVHINTHLDAYHENIRLQEIEVLQSYISDFRSKGFPVFVTGDFNSVPDSPVLETLLETLTDARSAAKKAVSTHTYNAYANDESASYRSHKTIDYCLFSGPVTVDRFMVTEKWDGGWMSDHNALTIQATICKR